MANVIGDIAGNYKTLMALLAKMPDEQCISVGDFVDRGPRSKQVIDFLMEHGRAVLGNHDQMFADTYRGFKYYNPDHWLKNYGKETLDSYHIVRSGMHHTFQDCKLVPEGHIEWIESLPLYIDEDGFFISHAPKRPDWTLEQCLDLGENMHYGYPKRNDDNILWNRGTPRRMPSKFQLFGHNSVRSAKVLGDHEGAFAIMLDTSMDSVLTGFNTTNQKLYCQEYID